MVLGALFIIGTTIWSTRFSFGVFFKSLETEFALGRAATSAVFSAYTVLCSGMAIMGGWIADRYGPSRVIVIMGLATGLGLALTSLVNSPWQLFITYSLLLSIGTGGTYVMVMSTTSRWFDKRRGLALGIAGAGSGLGMAVGPPLGTYLISDFGWRHAYLIIGVATWLIVLPLSRLLKKDPRAIGTVPDGRASHEKEMGHPPIDSAQHELSIVEVFKTSSFWLLSVNELFCAYAQFFLLTHLVPHITDLGFSDGEAAAVLGLLGGMGVLGRLLAGAISDRIGRKTTGILSMFIMAAAVVWLIWVRDIRLFYVFALVYGLAYGGRATVFAAIISDTFGLRNLGLTLGLMETGWAIGAGLGPALGGLIFDETGSYFVAFVVAAVATFASMLTMIPLKRETPPREQTGRV